MTDHAMCSFLSLTGTCLLVRDPDECNANDPKIFVVALRHVTVIEHNINYHPSKFQSSWLSRSNFTEGG